MERSKAAALAAENMKTIFAYALSRVSHREDAEDLAGDIIAAIITCAPSLRNEEAFFGWVWSIAANTTKKFLRQRTKHPTEELDESMADAFDTAEDILRGEEIALLRRELALLSKEYRECTVAYYFRGLSCAQTAEELGISLEMVKYYLFKTRKRLREGFDMIREFGEKSYNPVKFNFVTIFSGKYNPEYRNLFDRKLPGNILYSAYYTPMTVCELAMEMGVASVYMEDEIALLEKYGLISARPGGKYQTNLVIFTREYADELLRTVGDYTKAEIKAILASARENLSEVRALGFPGANLDDNRLLWALLWPLMRWGHDGYEENHPRAKERSPLYDGASGTNYGVDYDEYSGETGCAAFAGFSGLDEHYAVCFADFGVLPKEMCYAWKEDAVREELHAVLSEKAEAKFPLLSRTDMEALENIFAVEIARMTALYERLTADAAELMKVHAPKNPDLPIEQVVSESFFMNNVGLIGWAAVKSGVLTIPEEECCPAMLIYPMGKPHEIAVGCRACDAR